MIDPAWKQHFPTYDFKDRDIALEEYRFATKSLESEERVYLNAANLTVAIGAALGSLILGSLNKLVEAYENVVPEIVIYSLVLLFTYWFGTLSLRYFADRRKAVVFAARKVIVLRRMLGMSYGPFQLVLPNQRIEGADDPFTVRLFPGWNSEVMYPCYAISSISSLVAFFVLASLINWMQNYGIKLFFIPLPLIVGVAAACFVSLSWNYRKALFETHDSVSLVFAMRIARLLNITLVDNIEEVIYRATLAKYELHRKKVNITELQKILDVLHDKEKKRLGIVRPCCYRSDGQAGHFFDSLIGSQVDQPRDNGHSFVIEVVVISIGVISNTILLTP